MILCLSYLCVKISRSMNNSDAQEEKEKKNNFYLSAWNNRWIVFHVWHFLISTLYFISRQQITNPKYVISYPDVHHSTHGLISTSIGLNMRINSQYFEDGVLRIKCVASISPTIFLNKETVIQQQGLQQFPDIPAPSIDSREALFLGIITTKTKLSEKFLSQNTF